MLNEKKEITEIIAITRKIDDRKTAELKVLEQKAELEKQRIILEQRNKELEELNTAKKLILGNMNDVVCRLDLPSLNFTFVTGACYNIFGYTPEEYVQLSVKDVTPPDSYKLIAEAITSDIAKYRRGETNHPQTIFEVQQYRKNRSLVWVEISARMVLNEKNEIAEIISVTRNIEKRKAFEFKTLEQKTELEKQKVELEQQKVELEQQKSKLEQQKKLLENAMSSKSA